MNITELSGRHLGQSIRVLGGPNPDRPTEGALGVLVAITHRPEEVEVVLRIYGHDVPVTVRWAPGQQPPTVDI